MIDLILGDALPYLITAGLAVLAFFGIKRSGRKAERQKNEIEELQADKETRERIDNAKPANNADDARGNLAKWLRRPDK